MSIANTKALSNPTDQQTRRRSSTFRRDVNALFVDASRRLSVYSDDVEQGKETEDESSVSTIEEEEHQSHHDAKSSELKRKTETFFLWAFAPLLMVTLMKYVWNVFNYIILRDWGTNAAAMTFDIDDPDETVSNSPKNQIMLNAHAFLGTFFVVIILLQLFSAIRRHHGNGTWRKVHKISGRVFALLWVVGNFSGMYYTIVSERFHDTHNDTDNSWYIVTCSLWIHGIASLANLFYSMYAIRQKKDVVEHVTAIFFAIWTIMSVRFMHLLVSIWQSFQQDCYLGKHGFAIGISVTEPPLLILMYICMRRYNPELAKMTLTRANLGVLALKSLLVLAVSMSFLIVKNSAPEGICYFGKTAGDE